MKTALIAGATGLTGSQLLPLLLESDNYGNVIVLSRRPIKLDNSKAEIIVTDFNDLQTDLAGISIDDVFCCLGTTIKKAGSKDAFRQVDYQYCLDLAEQCLALGASHFLLISALGASTKSLSFYSRTKGELERDLKSLNYPSLTILQPSLIDGDRSEERFGEEIALKLMKPLSAITQNLIPGITPVKASEIAACLYHCAAKPEQGFNVIKSDSIREIAAK